MINMKKTITHTLRALAILQILAITLFIPVSASAHYFIQGDTFQLVAGAGAADHGHDEVPVVGGAGDGHTDHAHTTGESGILKPGSTAWWGVMVTSLIFMSALSVAVWKYLQVPPVKSAEIKQNDKPEVKPEEKTPVTQ